MMGNSLFITPISTIDLREMGEIMKLNQIRQVVQKSATRLTGKSLVDNCDAAGNRRVQ